MPFLVEMEASSGLGHKGDRGGAGDENLSLAPICSVQFYQEYATHSHSFHWWIILHTGLKMSTRIIKIRPG